MEDPAPPAWALVLRAPDDDTQAQVHFLYHLAQHGILSRALHASRCSRAQLDRWLAGPPAGFPKLYRWALDSSADVLEGAAFDRAIHGWDEPVYGNDGTGRTVQIDTKRVRSDALLLALLKARRPSAFKDRLGTPVRDLAGRRAAFEAAVTRLRGLDAAKADGAPGAPAAPAAAPSSSGSRSQD